MRYNSHIKLKDILSVHFGDLIYYIYIIYILYIYVYSEKIPPIQLIDTFITSHTYLFCRCVRKLKFYPPAGTCGKSLQSCPTLCNPMDYSPPGSSVHGILQERILERVAMPFSRGSSWPRDQTRIFYVSWIGRWVLDH